MEGALSAALAILFALIVSTMYGMYEWNRYDLLKEECVHDRKLWTGELSTVCSGAIDLDRVPGRRESCERMREALAGEAPEQCPLNRWFARQWLVASIASLRHYLLNDRTGLAIAGACGAGLMFLIIYGRWKFTGGGGGGGGGGWGGGYPHQLPPSPSYPAYYGGGQPYGMPPSPGVPYHPQPVMFGPAPPSLAWDPPEPAYHQPRRGGPPPPAFRQRRIAAPDYGNVARPYNGPGEFDNVDC